MQAAKAESVKDYDTALDYYNKALQAEPNNTEYKLKAARARFEAAQWHVDQGRRFREQCQPGTGAGGIPQGADDRSIQRRGAAGSASHDGRDQRQERDRRRTVPASGRHRQKSPS